MNSVSYNVYLAYMGLNITHTKYSFYHRIFKSCSVPTPRSVPTPCIDVMLCQNELIVPKEAHLVL